MLELIACVWACVIVGTLVMLRAGKNGEENRDAAFAKKQGATMKACCPKCGFTYDCKVPPGLEVCNHCREVVQMVTVVY